MGQEQIRYPRYEELKDKNKTVRRAILGGSGILDRKRFLLSHSPEVRKKLAVLQEAVRELKTRYPEVVSLGIFGSHTKGYANTESDIDGHLFVEDDRLSMILRQPYSGAYQTEGLGDLTRETRRYGAILRDAIKQRGLCMSEEELRDVFVDFISTNSLQDDLSNGRWDNLTKFFLLDIGGRERIKMYRKEIIDFLSSGPKDSEAVWRSIMADLEDFERPYSADSSRKQKPKSVYPQTLPDARRYFLGEKTSAPQPNQKH